MRAVDLRLTPFDLRRLGEPSRSARRQLLAAVMLAVLGCSAVLPVGAIQAGEITQQFFQQLRQRRLFSLAEGYCLRNLSRTNLASAEQVELILELSRTFAEHAKHTSGAEQSDLWNRATKVLDDFVEKQPRHPQRVLLEVQSVLIPASRGEYLRWQAELFPFDESLKQQAITALTDVVPKLMDMEESLAEQVRAARPSRGATDGQVRPHELRMWLQNVRYRLGLALLDQAALLKRDSADRADALIDANGWFKRLSGGVVDTELTWNSRIRLAEVARRRRDPKLAEYLLKRIEEDEPPAGVRSMILAEHMKLRLSESNSAGAGQLLLDARKSGTPMSAELQFLHVRTLSEMRDVAIDNNKAVLAADLMEQLETETDRAESDYAGYWPARCRTILEFARDTSKYGRNLARLTHRARSLYAAGRSALAIEAYGDAATEALAAKRDELAMDLGYTRASIQIQNRQYETAAASFHKLASGFPKHRRAANAHLLWAFCLGQLYQQQRTPNRLEDYGNSLVEHRAQFPGTSTAAEGTWMLARLQEQQSQVTKALQLYEQIPAGHRRGSQAQVAVARCYETILNRLQELKQPADNWHRDAIARLTGFAAEFPAVGTPLNVDQAEVALRLARIWLNQRQPEFVKADRLLESVIASRPAMPASAEDAQQQQSELWLWLTKTATQLRIVSLSGQHRMKEARTLVSTLSQNHPAEVLTVLDGLMQLADNAEPETRQRIGDLQLQAAEALQVRRLELTAAQRTRLNHCLAQACVATKQPRRAAGIYESLVVQAPKDKQLRRTTAELLIQCGSTEYLQRSKTHWRKLESLEKLGSAEWLDARYHLAWCYFALKEFSDCKKLLVVTRLRFPKLGGGKLKDRFNKLAVDVKKAAG